MQAPVFNVHSRAIPVPLPVSLVTDGWTIATVVISALALFMAVLSVVWVATQAKEARRATKISQEALNVAQATAIESIKARLDQNSPRVRVEASMDQEPYYPDAGPVPGLLPIKYGYHNPVTMWHLPSEKSRKLCVRVKLTIKNMSDQIAYLKFNGPITDLNFKPLPRILPGEQEITALVQANFTIEKWSENWQDHQEGKPYRNLVAASVDCSDDSETCAMDSWTLDVTGWPIQQTGEGLWVLAKDPAEKFIEFNQLPLRKRTYWVSRTRQILLPEAALAPESNFDT